jgi:V8-like Glu-specific endopeptidase
MKLTPTLLALTTIAIGFSTVNTVNAATDVVEEAVTYQLPDNDVNIDTNTSATDFLSEIKRQYLQKYPDYNGVVTAYTPTQYKELQATGHAESMDMSYIARVSARQSTEKKIRAAGNLTVVSNMKVSPYSAVGIESAWFSEPNGIMVVSSPSLNYTFSPSEDDFTGSGFSIGPNRVATAAHCLYSLDSHKPIDGGLYAFQVNGLENNGIMRFTSVSVPSSYSSAASGSSVDDVAASDYGVAHVSLTNGDQPSALPLASGANSVTGKLIGYPSDPQSGYDGNTMVYSSGTVTALSSNPINIYESSSMLCYHGFSGGPVVDSTNHVVGIGIYTVSNNDTGKEVAGGFRRMTSGVSSFLLNN